AHPDPLWALLAAVGPAVVAERIFTVTQSADAREAQQFAQEAANTASQAAQLALAAVMQLERLATRALDDTTLVEATADAAAARAAAQAACQAFQTLE